MRKSRQRTAESMGDGEKKRTAVAPHIWLMERISTNDADLRYGIGRTGAGLQRLRRPRRSRGSEIGHGRGGLGRDVRRSGEFYINLIERVDLSRDAWP